jgi:hypothetical protein
MLGGVNMRCAGVARFVLERLTAHFHGPDPGMRWFAALSLASRDDESAVKPTDEQPGNQGKLIQDQHLERKEN